MVMVVFSEFGPTFLEISEKNKSLLLDVWGIQKPGCLAFAMADVSGTQEYDNIVRR